MIKFKSIGILSVAALLAGAVSTKAEPIDGFYAGFSGGVSVLEKLTIDDVDTPFGPQPGGYIKSHAGYDISGTAGWGFGNGLRTELELNYRENEFYRATAGALKDADARGNEQRFSTFFNVLYDFDLSKQGINWVVPYVGAGLGGTWAKWRNVDTYNPAELVRHNSSSDASLAYQLIAGAAFPIPKAPRLSLTTEYRYTASFDDQSFDGRVLMSRFGSFPITTNTDNSSNHTVMIGLRYAFGK